MVRNRGRPPVYGVAVTPLYTLICKAEAAGAQGRLAGAIILCLWAPEMAIPPAARPLKTLKRWVGEGSSSGLCRLGPQNILLDPRSQLALLDRGAALWSGKNPLRILKQSSGHNHLIAGASTWAAVSASSQEALGLHPPGSGVGCALGTK